MKVRMVQRIIGTLDGVSYPAPGEEWDVPDAVGANLCDRGFAEPVAEKASDKAEKAVPRKKAEKRG